jgi:chromosomal replication initiator protein
MLSELIASSRLAIQAVDTYLTFPENQFARAAMIRIGRPRDPSINATSRNLGTLTVVSGPPGSGKSHLVRATLNRILKENPALRYVFVSSEHLSQQLEAADYQQSLADFLDEFRSLDILVCEDLERLESNPDAQQRLLMLVEILEKEFTDVLFTSKRPVGELHSIDQRLVSRCHGGLCVAMPFVGLESRTRLVQHWFQEFKLPILRPLSAAARFFAERLPLSPRDLRHMIVELTISQKRRPQPIDVAYLERWLNRHDRSPRLSLDSIVTQVAREFGVEAADIRSKSRNHVITVPRQCAMLLARELTGRPLDKIGKFFHRSHTTVSHSMSRLNQLLPRSPSLREQVAKLRKQLQELPLEDCGKSTAIGGAINRSEPDHFRTSKHWHSVNSF